MCQPLREVCAEIEWDNDTFEMYYITLRQLSTNQTAGDDHTIHQSADHRETLDSDRVAVHLYDEVKLNEELRDSLSLDEPTSRPAVVRFTANGTSPAYIALAGDEDGRPCYIGRVSGAQLAVLFIQQQRSHLFNLNIRNYLGDNATNKAIRRTAEKSPKDFFFFNNGISALANRVEADDSDDTILRCENLSVINGAQTVRSLHKAHTKNPEALRKVQVLLRLTEVSAKKTGTEQELLDNVTKYNNTQTAIRLSDFRSNDKVQSDIANKFAQLPAVDGKKFIYKNKRSGEAANGRTIGMEEFVKTVYAFRFGPDDVFGGTAHVFDATKDGGYTKLFGSDGEILPTLDNETFALYAGIWFLCSSARDLWRARSANALEPALERRWMFFYAIGAVLQYAYTTLDRDLEADLRKLGDPSWMRKGSGEIQAKALGALSKFAFKALVDTYRQATEKPGFARRNRFRSPSTLTGIGENVASSWDLVSSHAEDYALVRLKSARN